MDLKTILSKHPEHVTSVVSALCAIEADLHAEYAFPTIEDVGKFLYGITLTGDQQAWIEETLVALVAAGIVKNGVPRRDGGPLSKKVVPTFESPSVYSVCRLGALAWVKFKMTEG